MAALLEPLSKSLLRNIAIAPLFFLTSEHDVLHKLIFISHAIVSFLVLNFPFFGVEYFDVFNLNSDCLLNLEHVAFGHVIVVV